MAAVWYPNGDRDYWNRLERQRQAEQAQKAQKALEAQRQRELEAILQAQAQTRAMILNQAFVSTPPPSKNLSTQKVLESIESLQSYLKQAI